MTPETTTWDALRQLRIGGQKPSLPVIVTMNEKLPQRLWGVGVLVIVHKAGEVMPIKLLDGLDVIFMLDRCDLLTSVRRLAKAKDVVMTSSKVYCPCVDILTMLPMCCESVDEAKEWMESAHAT